MSSERGAKYDLRFVQGKTFQRTLRPSAKPYIYKPVTGITKAAPARITAVAHGIPDGNVAAVVSVLGMRQINALNDPPKDADFHPVTVIDADHVELNDVNAAGFSTYTSGGYLQFQTPTDLTGALVRLTVRDKIGGTALLTLDSSGHGITVDATNYLIEILVSAADTAAMTWRSGIYDAEVEFSDGTVDPLLWGSATVERELTT